MGLGSQVLAEERLDERGQITTQIVAQEGFGEGGAAGLADLRRHFILSASYSAGHPFRIVAGQAVRVDVGGGRFEKYEVIARNAVQILVAFDRQATAEDYDDVLLSGWQARSDRCEPASFVSLFFAAAPADPVDVVLYAGRMADPA